MVTVCPSLFFTRTTPFHIYTLSLHDALPICDARSPRPRPGPLLRARSGQHPAGGGQDRKSTRLNSSHITSSYAVFCLKKKISMRCTLCGHFLQVSLTLILFVWYAIAAS